MSVRPNPRREIPTRVRVSLERRRCGAAGLHGCRTARTTERRNAIARSARGE